MAHRSNDVALMWGRLAAFLPLVFPVLGISQKLWGGPPVRAGPLGAKPPLEQMPEQKVTSLDPLFANRISLIHHGQAGQGAGRGPGVRPTIFAGRPVMGKTSGIKKPPSLPTSLPPQQPYRIGQDATAVRFGRFRLLRL